MGKSAKLHKRIKKTAINVSKATHASSSIQTPSSNTSNVNASSTTTSGNPSVKRRQGLKAKVSAKKSSSAASGSSGGKTDHVLGGADYVDMMMGSRRKAREEAAKMPVD